MVKRFKYRLERVLGFRELVKDEKLRELMLKNKLLNDAEDRLKELEAAVLLNQLNANIAVVAEDIKSIGEYSQRLKTEIEHQNIEVEDARTEVNKARQTYIEASKDAEMLQKHKQQKTTEYKDYLQKEEEKFLDELVTQRINLQEKE